MKPINTPILTVGSMAFDSIESPAGKVEGVLGGSVNYFSIAASFHSPVQIVAVVGDDFPKDHLKWLATKNIDVSGVEIAAGKTFHWKGSYNKDLNEAETHHTALNVFEAFNPKLTSSQSQATHVFLANIDPTLQHSVLEQTKNAKLVACDTMNFWIQGRLEELKKTFKKIDILIINDGEAKLLTGEKNILKAAKKVREMGPKTLVIKRGEYGATLFTDSGLFFCPAHLVEEVKDPTGAGDSFAGAFMGYLASHGADRELAKSNPAEWEHLLRRAVLAGCVMSSFTVEDFSVRRLMKLTPEELASRQERLLKMMAV